MRKSLSLILLFSAAALFAAAPAAPSFAGVWEKLIGEKGCLVSASDVKCSLEGSVFAKADWQAFLKAAKKDERIFRFVLSQFSSRKPTEIHICNFRNATEGEIAVFAAQRIAGANWYDYDGHDKELKKIIGTETAAKVQLLKQVLGNDRLCASLQRYFFRKYVTTLRLDEFRAKAEKGDAAAQLELGMRLLYANGGEEAVKYLRLAARQGHPTARGWCLFFGCDVKKDHKAAVECFRSEASKGEPWAQFLLGKCFAWGNGVEQNSEEATRWFRKAAERGNPLAQFHLSERYYFGDGGVAKNPAEERKWMQKSAEQGFEPALRALDAWELEKRPAVVIETAR